MKISVIVPYRNEKRHIGRFLDSLLTQDLDPGWDLEIDDSFPGSTDAPFRLLSRAVAAAAPGDTVIVRDGAHGHENAESGGTAAIVRDRSSVSSWSIDHNRVFGA